VDINSDSVTNIKEHTTVCELFWGTENVKDSLPANLANPNQPKSVDVVFGADLTYDFDDLPLLIATLRQLCDAHTVVIIAYGKERAATPSFLEQASEHFHLEHVPDSEINYQDVVSQSYTIGIVKMTLKQHA
jgi:hypothetical protein